VHQVGNQYIVNATVCTQTGHFEGITLNNTAFGMCCRLRRQWEVCQWSRRLPFHCLGDTNIHLCHLSQIRAFVLFFRSIKIFGNLLYIFYTSGMTPWDR